MAFNFDWLLCYVRKQDAALQAEIDALQAQVDAIVPGADDWLLEAAQSEGYEMTPITRDVDSVITTGTVRWPDGTAGVFTTVTKNNTWLTVDAYTLTYAGTPAKTLTQPLVTRDANGAVTVKPLIIIS